MKKRLLIAAVAATMSVAATAGISITGDAYVSFASQKVLSSTGTLDTTNNDNQRVRVKIVGSVDDTEVVAVIHGGNQTRVDPDPNVMPVDKDKGVKLDSLYVTSKLGPVSIKAGDYWGTIGLGAHSMEAAKKNALSLSTEIAPGWKLGVFTADGSTATGSDSTNINVSGKINPSITVGAVHNPNNFTDVSAQVTLAALGGISIAAEYWDDTATTNNDTIFLQIGGGSTVKWDIAYIENDIGAFTGTTLNTADPHTTGKLAPLGSMLIGKGARGATATAVADVGDFTEILGVAVSTEVYGNTIKAIYTENTVGDVDDVKGTEIIVSRPLANGATLTANIGKVSGISTTTLGIANIGISNNDTNTGIRLDVKF